MFQVRLVHFSIASVPAKLMFSAQTSLSHFVLTCEVLEEFDEAGESVAVEPLCHLLGCGIWIRTIKLEKAEGGGGQDQYNIPTQLRLLLSQDICIVHMVEGSKLRNLFSLPDCMHVNKRPPSCIPVVQSHIRAMMLVNTCSKVLRGTETERRVCLEGHWYRLNKVKLKNKSV